MLPLSLIWVLNFLDVHICVDLFNKLRPYNTVVGGAVAVEKELSLLLTLVEELVHPPGVKELIDTGTMSVTPHCLASKSCFYLQWGVVTRAEGRVSHDKAGFSIWISFLKIMENLSCALAASSNSNAVLLKGIVKKAGKGGAVGG